MSEINWDNVKKALIDAAKDIHGKVDKDKIEGIVINVKKHKPESEKAAIEIGVDMLRSENKKNESYLISKKDLDMIKFKVQWAFEQLFENKIRGQETINRLNAIDESQNDLDLLQSYLDALKIDYGWLLNEHNQRVKADFFDWSERR